MSTLISENEPLISQKASLINPDIKWMGIINKRGKLVDSIGKGGIDLPKAKRNMFFMKIALRNSMQEDFDEDLGVVNYCVTQRGNKKYVSVPVGRGNTVLAIAKNEADLEKVVGGINQILKYSQHFLGEKISEEEGR